MEFLRILNTILISMFGVSAVSTALNNFSAKNRIRKAGFEVDGTNTSLTEKITYFLQDYAFLLVPIYNIKKSLINNFFKRGAYSYEIERKEKYKQRRMLYKVDEEGNLNLVPMNPEDAKNFVRRVKPQIKEAEKPKEVKQVKVKKEEPKEEVTKKVNKSTKEFASLEEEYAYYSKLFNKQKQDYLIAEQEKTLCYEDRYALYLKVKETQEHYKSLKHRLELQNTIDEAKEVRSNIITLDSNRKKLR